MLRLAALFMFLVSLTGAGCAGAEPAATPAPAEVSGTVRLTPGESVASAGHVVRFVEVVEDSRCPQDVTCVTEGVARIRIAVDDQTAVLTVPGSRPTDGDRSTVTVGRLTVAVTGLEPVPVSSGPREAPVAVIDVR